ncbi:hypothetical protein N3K66_001806 [Trichothecium roseum]|uniref:Uncharacterized protein n=1 Tax=Trichothecium roseum TaxID=47278 RepID=A0ACC0V7U2_9HYPO|nr:hypothetical protein N3K66_001806 [Trichothecium roseum]
MGPSQAFKQLMDDIRRSAEVGINALDECPRPREPPSQDSQILQASWPLVMSARKQFVILSQYTHLIQAMWDTHARFSPSPTPGVVPPPVPIPTNPGGSEEARDIKQESISSEPRIPSQVPSCPDVQTKRLNFDGNESTGPDENREFEPVIIMQEPEGSWTQKMEQNMGESSRCSEDERANE